MPLALVDPDHGIRSDVAASGVLSPVPQSQEDHTVGFWRWYLRLGNAILVIESSLVAIYLATSGSRPDRTLLLSIAGGAAVAGLVPLVFSAQLSTRSWRAGFALCWTLLSGLLLAIFVHMDGGMDSPMLGLMVLPIMYAALALRPRAVIACCASGAVELVVIGSTDPNIILARDHLLMWYAALGGVGALALISSINRSRLEDLDATLMRAQIELAETDGLTGCLNHRAFSQRLDAEVDRAVRRHYPLSLLIADVDLLKDFNDVHGHLAGDAALRIVGATLLGACRSIDASGRVGGDEFAILLPDTSVDDARGVAERITDRMRDQRRPSVTVSIGAASLDLSSPSSRQLFRDADAAMYLVKANGRGGVADERRSGRLASVTARSPGWDDVQVMADRKRLEDRLRLSQRETTEALAVLETLQANAPVGFSLVDRDFRILRTNSMLAAINGSPAEDQIGRTIAEVVPDIWPKIEPFYSHVLNTGEAVVNIEIKGEMFGDPGRVHHWLSSFYPVPIDDEVVGIGAVVVDISERHDSEESKAKLTHATVAALAAAGEVRDPYTAGHQHRVAEISFAVATELGLDAFTAEGIELAASIHDIGKIAVPAEILSRPGRLSDAEMLVVRGHCKAAESILAPVDFPWPVAEMVVQHHERVDGSGYPDGLRGDEINIGARIIGVADVVEAMSSHRPYRPAKGLDAALQEIEDGRGRLYDAPAVDACLRLFRDGRLSASFGAASTTA